MTELLGIGELARASGLTVSALRFYDREGVLAPAVVDPATGYRRYAAAQLRLARLVAGMRRIGVPLADIAVAVDHLGSGPDGDGDVASVRGIVAGHVARLEEGLVDARREAGRLMTLLADAGDEGCAGTTTATEEWVVDGVQLVAVLLAVRFAVGSDPDFPVLHGVLLELDGTTCRAVATDRFRMAVADAPVHRRTETATTTAVAPTTWVGEVIATRPTGRVRIAISHTVIRLETASGDVVEERLVPGDYPDHRRLLDHLQHLGEGEADASALATLVRAASPRHTGEDGADLVVLSLSDDRLSVDEGPGVAVRREFLLDALDAVEASGQQPVLRLDGPITPLVIAGRGGTETTWSLLMPVRLPDRAG
ncbi:MerR family transcriptional regulator [Lapillicoccus sp.]|uniref:DNA polymerase III subunit beta family protein n=1 Tax=Lapillicoccus sp. TaxID=1909287 RepID=UPI0025FE5215|nr:MerR family transcriptional regulator [Lapillicoccus sp.]